MVNEILLEGAGNAQTGKSLCGILGLTPRELTQAIEHERRQGFPICASTGSTPGYFLAANQDEMRWFCESLKHRAGEIHKTRKACLKTLATLPGREN